MLGSKGSALGGFALNKFEYYNLPKANLSKYETNPKSVYGFGHLKFYKHVLKSLRTKQPSEFEAKNAIKTVQLINAIYKLLRQIKKFFLKII